MLKMLSAVSTRYIFSRFIPRFFYCLAMENYRCGNMKYSAVSDPLSKDKVAFFYFFSSREYKIVAKKKFTEAQRVVNIVFLHLRSVAVKDGF